MADPLAAEARRLRTGGVGADKLQEWLRGIPPPGWTKRPNAKDELRAEAVSLREQGRSVPEIAAELGVARSTAW